MEVKCKACGNKINRDIAYKIIINTKNQYYCNEQEYLNIQKEKDARIKVFSIIEKIIGNTTNTILFKEIGFLAKSYSYVLLEKYLVENMQELQINMAKIFSNEYGKIKYFSTIIKNNIGDFKEINKSIENKSFNIEMVKTKYTPKKRKKSLNQYMEEYE
jgi:hypothetical protein